MGFGAQRNFKSIIIGGLTHPNLVARFSLVYAYGSFQPSHAYNRSSAAHLQHGIPPDQGGWQIGE